MKTYEMYMLALMLELSFEDIKMGQYNMQTYHPAQNQQWNEQWHIAQLWLRAVIGDANAQNELGTAYYLEGHKTAEKYENALYWFQKAAEIEHAQASFNLGLMYANGQGVVKNHKIAVAWFRKAAEIRKRGKQTD